MNTKSSDLPLSRPSPVARSDRRDTVPGADRQVGAGFPQTITTVRSMQGTNVVATAPVNGTARPAPSAAGSNYSIRFVGLGKEDNLILPRKGGALAKTFTSKVEASVTTSARFTSWGLGHHELRIPHSGDGECVKTVTTRWRDLRRRRRHSGRRQCDDGEGEGSGSVRAAGFGLRLRIRLRFGLRLANAFAPTDGQDDGPDEATRPPSTTSRRPAVPMATTTVATTAPTTAPTTSST